VCVCVKETVQVKNENVMHSWLHFESSVLTEISHFISRVFTDVVQGEIFF